METIQQTLLRVWSEAHGQPPQPEETPEPTAQQQAAQAFAELLRAKLG